MKKYLLLLCLLLIIAVFANARTLEITKLSTSTIQIGNQKCQVGSTFSDESIIYWSSPKQLMWVKYIDGPNRGQKKCLTRESFISRKVKTPKDYFNKTNHPSTRGDDIDFIEGKNKSSDKRIALVIGNSNYLVLETLSNPINDASDVAEKLVTLGFDVFLINDANYGDFDKALKKFSRHADDKDYDVALFYYCGHGIQYKDREYLVPINSRLYDSEDLDSCIDLRDDVYAKMERTNCTTKLVFIDACRTEKNWNGKKLEINKEPEDICAIFSTSPNAAALDGEERNSPFTNAVLTHIGEPSSDVASTLNKIIQSVKIHTNNEQVPRCINTGSNFTFVEPIAVQSNETLLVTDIRDLESLAEKGDTRAYIKIAEYYLYHGYGKSADIKAHTYAKKAWDAGIDKEKALEIFKCLDSLGFYQSTQYVKPKY